jgi:hypothetical protein
MSKFAGKLELIVWREKAVALRNANALPGHYPSLDADLSEMVLHSSVVTDHFIL